jgi:hypothetical protein
MEEGLVRGFLADYDGQVSEIDRIYDTLAAKARLVHSGSTREIVESIGYWLHNLYSAYEDLFKIVASFWENSVPPDGTYHVLLLKRMRTTVEGVRPAVLSPESYQHLDELRGFRHVFRHAYSYGLDGDRVTILLRKVLDHRTAVHADLERFRNLIREAAGIE